MRWEDERYVRLYTRDTVGWKLLPWQGRALLPLILRKVDRAGVIDLGADGSDGLAVMVDLPPEVVSTGLDGLIRRGCVEVAGGRLVVPNFLAAQESRASDRLRAQEHRERARAVALAGDGVTKRDDSSQNVTGASRNVTIRHDSSHGVTPHHTASLRAVPCRALPSRAVQGGAGGCETATNPTDDPEAPAPVDPASAAVAGTTSAADGKGDDTPTAADLAAAVSILALVAEIARDARKATPEPRKRRERKPPPPDTIPLPGTPARAIYDALTGDPILRPIVAGPGDFAERLADPAAYPGVPVLAEIKRAAEYASRHPGQYTDGRRYLTSWLTRAAERVPPKPATPPPAPKRPVLTEAQERALSPFANLEQRIAERDARLAAAAKH